MLLSCCCCRSTALTGQRPVDPAQPGPTHFVLRRGWATSIAVLALWIMAATAIAQPAREGVLKVADQPAQRNVSAPKTADEAFAMAAARGHLYEIAGGRLAMERANNSAVREFAAGLVDDHSRAHEQLVKIAREMGITLPAAVSQAQQTALGRLGGLTGPSFDRQFVQTIGVDALDLSISQFRKAAKTARAAALRDFAMQRLPVLEQKLSRARTLALATQKIASDAGRVQSTRR